MFTKRMNNWDIIKKILISLVALILFFGFFEAGFIIYGKFKFDNFPPAPDSAEGFGNFGGFLNYLKQLGYAQDFYSGSGAIYAPYTITALKPNFDFKIKNIDYTGNSLGFRAGEIAMPKPNNIYRIFILGGSTVEGGFNEKWMISSYLQNKLQELTPDKKIEVINAGVIGYFSQNELILLETKIFDLEPDLVVIFDGRNDIYYSVLPGWKKRENGDYLAQQKILDSFINYPSLRQLLAYDAKILVKKSSFLTGLFRMVFRQGASSVYPNNIQINNEGAEAYLDNLKLAKAVLESKGVKGALVFQPTLGYCKDNVSDYEISVINYLKDVEKTNWINEIKVWWPRVGDMVKNIPDSENVKTYDLSCLFKDFKDTVYIDSVHYVPESYQEIGEKLAEIIKSDFIKK